MVYWSHMNRGRQRSHGYTIIETMIFLAVSAALFISAVVMIGGRLERERFEQAVRGFETELRDIANDVSTGYYVNSSDSGNTFTCLATTVGVSFGSSSTEKGANKGCIFIGRAVQFAPTGSDGKSFNVITLVGKQWESGFGSPVVNNYQESTVTAVVQGASNAPFGTPDAAELVQVGSGVTVACVFYGTTSLNTTTPCDTTGATYIDTVAFITTFHGTSPEGHLESGSSQVDLVVPINGSSTASGSLGRDLESAAEQLNNYDQDDPNNSADDKTVKNPESGVFICLQSNGSEQFALLSLGGKSSRYSAQAQISNGKCTT